MPGIDGTNGSRPSPVHQETAQPENNSQAAEVTPKVPREKKHSEDTQLTTRRISTTKEQPPRVNQRAHKTHQLKAEVAKLQAELARWQEQQAVLDHMDAVKEQLTATSPDCDLSVSYLDENGQEISLIPPDEKLAQNPALKTALTKALLAEIKEIDDYFSPERRAELAEHLLNTSSQLLTLNKELQLRQSAPPVIPDTPDRIYCDLAILTAPPEVPSFQEETDTETPPEIIETTKHSDEMTTEKVDSSKQEKPVKRSAKKVSFADEVTYKTFTKQSAPSTISKTEERTQAIAPSHPANVYVIDLPETPSDNRTEVPRAAKTPPAKADKSTVKTAETVSLKTEPPPSEKSQSQQWLDFYREGNVKIHGQQWTLEKIRALNDQQMEKEHNYIQLLFPNKAHSNFNTTAPLLTPEIIREIRRDPKLKNEVERSLNQIMAFWGIQRKGHEFQIIPDQTDRHNKWCRDNGDHNHLRVSRVLNFLIDCGYEEDATNLEKTLQAYRIKQGVEPNPFWQEVVTRRKKTSG